ncbi:DUF3953 domain-containing protein [Halobacillus sp. Nhm2S1]|uniref:DUF3953 domain-containing protein n=1 Tax=Halobacillus sp. Nhm2S1 TaxID=2866716 RepID=UPI001C72DED0|nr:DUF3953 domain-containing protein [Halobacillus sp. Nhm2S1]MBX0358459.1 DUF3953 domain-containing protein [Halobacillus sp. Nhm2S1]
MKAIRIVAAFIAISLIVLSVITDNKQILYYTQFFIGAMLLIYSISEFQNKRKARAVYLLFLAGIIVLMGALSLSN